MTTKHTPGRWSCALMRMTKPDWAALHSGKHPIDIVKRGDDVIAAVWCGDDQDGEEQANAHLIAAAPDMLEALKAVLPLLRHPTSAELEVRKMVLAALAKARGEG